MTQAGKLLGMTFFRYVDETEVLSQLVRDPLRLCMILRELVKNPAQLQALLSAIWSPEHVSLRTDSNIAQILDPLNIQGQGKTVAVFCSLRLFLILNVLPQTITVPATDTCILELKLNWCCQLPAP